MATDAEISALRIPGEWVNLKGLITCALQHLSTKEDSPETSLECTSISLLGSGTHNYVYRLSFSSGLDLAASIPRADEEDFYPAARLSEIATMKFVAESGLYPDVPVPKIHAWHIGFDNEAGSPWTLMDVVNGVPVENGYTAGHGVGVTRFDLYPQEKQMAIVKTLAILQTHLSKPVPFKEIGSIYLSEKSKTGFKVGPLVNLGQRNHHKSLGGPYTSQSHMYTTLLQDHMLHATRTWCSLPTDALHDPDNPFPLNLTPRTFSDVFHMLTSLIPHFTLPPSVSTLVLHHPDIALRNVLFDEASLKDGAPRITGVLDWAGAQVLPLMLTAVYPGDLLSNAVTPFHPPVFRSSAPPDTVTWFNHRVPFDWTSTGNPAEDWPQAAMWNRNTATDHGPALATQVRRFYLRTYFSACYARYMQEIHADQDLARASIYREAEYHLKFHAVMCAALNNWEQYEGWVKETYWRMRLTGRAGASQTVPVPVIGPNVYHAQVERPVRDLRMLEEEQDKWVRKFEEKKYGEEQSNGDENEDESEDGDEDEAA